MASIGDPVQAAIQKYAKHPSIVKINEAVEIEIFSFQKIDVSDSV